ncbi:hook-length control protein FliK [Noviherbaspirillum humi]|uniref:Hook-length control protein FliK n=1 Tax=Noviherbaspirillum humi TaxID=1688639 RepID=A0A239FXN5_9BURK|nr:flagellar hook-length control protein FliK [Noviherbaspirillum humi]SNS61671.1 hook-length control protein FliK [Noviherbaspirillum humi]
MIQRADLGGAKAAGPAAAIAASSPATGPQRDTLQRLMQLSVGQAYQASVLAKLQDGTFLVRVADAQARMALPAGTSAGDSIVMTFAGKEPIPTFLLARSGSSTAANVSDAGRMISNLLQSLQGGPDIPHVSAAQPLLEDALPANVGKVAEALHHAVESSGAFYESHVAEWVQGRRPLEAIKQEPQARFTQDAPVPDVPEAAPDSAGAASATPAEVDARLVVRQEPSMHITPEAASMVGIQLHALEQRELQWQGQLWPGQELQWTVREESGGHGSAGSGEAAWSSSVRFELPSLGVVSASIHVQGSHARVSLKAHGEAAATALQANGSRLAASLEASGTFLDQLTVARDGDR